MENSVLERRLFFVILNRRAMCRDIDECLTSIQIIKNSATIQLLSLVPRHP